MSLMSVLVNPDGTRNRSFRPYIDQEEYWRKVALTNPDSFPRDSLYTRDGPCACTSWSSGFNARKAAYNPVTTYLGGVAVEGTGVSSPAWRASEFAGEPARLRPGPGLKWADTRGGQERSYFRSTPSGSGKVTLYDAY